MIWLITGVFLYFEWISYNFSTAWGWVFAWGFHFLPYGRVICQNIFALFYPIEPQFAKIIQTLYFVLFYVIWFLEISHVVTSVTRASERCDFNKNDVSGTWIVIRPKKIYVCLLLHVKEIYGRSGIIFFFIIIIGKTGNSRSWFRNLIPVFRFRNFR